MHHACKVRHVQARPWPRLNVWQLSAARQVLARSQWPTRALCRRHSQVPHPPAERLIHASHILCLERNNCAHELRPGHRRRDKCVECAGHGDAVVGLHLGRVDRAHYAPRHAVKIHSRARVNTPVLRRRHTLRHVLGCAVHSVPHAYMGAVHTQCARIHIDDEQRRVRQVEVQTLVRDAHCRGVRSRCQGTQHEPYAAAHGWQQHVGKYGGGSVKLLFLQPRIRHCLLYTSPSPRDRG